MRKRASYHTSLKELVAHDLMPSKFLKSIPRTNLNRWRNDDFDRYVGSDINQIADKHLELIQTLNHYPKMFYAYGKLVNTMVGIAKQAENFKHLMKESKSQIVSTIRKTQDIISIEKAVKFFNISKSTFHAWDLDVQLECEKSVFKKCNRVYPNQILPQEVKNIKDLLLNPKSRHWSMISVYWLGIRQGLITVSDQTFYKVNKVFGFRDSNRRKRKKKRPKPGVRAESPNSIWHADITTLKALNGKRYYIYLVVDNFSRKILSYAVKEKVAGFYTLETIREAYNKAKLVTKNLNVSLIVDGGPENHNFTINDFINRSEINIRKLTALKDINSSNSMVERVNMTLKYRYIFPKEPRDLKHLKRILRYFIQDYNFTKPHGQLNGLTPNEAYSGKNRLKLIKQS